MYTNYASANDSKNDFNNTEYQNEVKDRKIRTFKCGSCLEDVKVMEGIDVHNLGISNRNSCLVCNECFLGNFEEQFQKMESVDSELICPYGVSCKQPPGKQFMDKQLIRSLLTPDKMNILGQRFIGKFKIYACPIHPKQ